MIFKFWYEIVIKLELILIKMIIRHQMKLSKFLNVLVTVEGVRRPRILMDNAVQMGRSMDQDRFIYQW